tara:strand:- start:459 stop:1301 length:843 start_codon:yes stop_codon:yes gene_type:complete
MDKLNLLTKIKKKNYFYYNDVNKINLVISNKLISNLNLNHFTVSFNSNNIIRYINKDIVIEIIHNINLKKLKDLVIENLDIHQIAKFISNPTDVQNNKLNYIIKKESYQDYKKNIKPYIKSIYKENTNWIWEIIKGNREKENILYQDNDVIILKDLSMTDNNNFYIIGFPIKKITCLREITKADLPVLDKLVTIMNNLAKTIGGFDPQNLYNFFHYHPSFYHLHLHCTFINNLNITGKFLRYHIYDIVKNNLLKNKNYYKKTDLYFEIPKNHIICNLLNN